ncbi:MAG: glycosyltransferase family 4 protein [Planctomycetes bacterium]|nr:glycosyltransferase family 4 protein [Planctomycetota bacterium]
MCAEHAAAGASASPHAAGRKLAAFMEVRGAGGATQIFLRYLAHLAGLGWDVTLLVGGRLSPELERTWRFWAGDLRMETIPWRIRSDYLFPVILPSLDFRFTRRLRRRFEQLAPDVILINQPGPDDAQGALRAAATVGGRPPVAVLVQLVAARDIRMRLRAPKLFWAKRVYAGADLVVTCSNACARSLAEDYGVAAHKIHVVPNGVPDAPSPPDAAALRDLKLAAGIRSGAVVVFWAGRYTVEKAPDVLFRAADILSSSDLDVQVVMAGDGPLRADLENRFPHLLRSGALLTLGWRDDVAALVAACDIAVMPSRLESFGMFIVEAMAASKPVVGTSVVGIPEVIADGETGVLVPPDDPRALADAILRLAADPGLRSRFGDAGRRRFNELFRFDSCAARFAHLLDALLRPPPP